MNRDFDLTRQLDPERKFIAAGTPEHTQGYIGGHYTRAFGPNEEGYVHEGGVHYIDHNTMLLMGDIEVHWGYKPGVVEGIVYIEGPKQLGDLPTQVPVLAGAWHRFIVRKRAVWMCVFAEAEADNIEEAEGAIPFNMERAHV